MIRKLTSLYLFFIALILASWAQAEPTALIEDISEERGDFQIMDFLEPGTIIQLKTNGLLVLGYMNSCIQESIVGGNVTIGEEKSVVVEGQVTRKTLTCGGNTKVSVTRNKKGDAGAVVFRNKKHSKRFKAEHEVHGISPFIFITDGSGKISIARVDGKGKKYEFAVDTGVVDLAQKGIKLRRNISYLLETNKRTTTFKISPKARRKVSLLGRLLRF